MEDEKPKGQGWRVFTRKQGQGIQVDGPAEIRLGRIRGSNVRIAIKTEANVGIQRLDEVTQPAQTSTRGRSSEAE